MTAILRGVRNLKIAVDAGHGGPDPGANVDKIREKDINLSVARILKEKLIDAGHEVIMTRDKDKLIGLYHRAKIANEMSCDIFVSIHNNAAGNPAATGSEVLHYPGSEKGEELAQYIQNKLVKSLGRPDRGTKPDDRFVVLNSTQMPAVIVEGLFITNSIDRDMLSKKEFHHTIAGAIAQGIEKYEEGI